MPRKAAARLPRPPVVEVPAGEVVGRQHLHDRARHPPEHPRASLPWHMCGDWQVLYAARASGHIAECATSGPRVARTSCVGGAPRPPHLIGGVWLRAHHLTHQRPSGVVTRRGRCHAAPLPLPIHSEDAGPARQAGGAFLARPARCGSANNTRRARQACEYVGTHYCGMRRAKPGCANEE